MTTLTSLSNTSSYAIVQSASGMQQICTHPQQEASTEFMVTSTTVENAGDASNETLNVTEREIVQQSSTIIPCVDHGDKSKGPQPIIAVIPPPEASNFEANSSHIRNIPNGINNDSNLVTCSSLYTLSESRNNIGKPENLF